MYKQNTLAAEASEQREKNSVQTIELYLRSVQKGFDRSHDTQKIQLNPAAHMCMYTNFL